MVDHTQIVGILNLTPDSFSDGGKAADSKIALARIDAMVEAGASVIDIGAESTRPGATPLRAEEEWARLETVLPLVCSDTRTYKLSIDTRHPETARQALALGVDWINDVSGLENPEMLEVVKDADCQLVFMHHLGIPADRNVVLQGTNPVEDIMGWATQRMEQIAAHGISTDRLIFDPGIGFGKTVEQTFRLLQHIQAFKLLGLPLMVGHSRKSFFSLVSSRPAAERDPETAALSFYLAQQGVDFLRVHDVAGSVAAVKLAEAL
ncbi:MAG: dihydropteroate synthase [Hyphomicrobiales bacterium]|nr:dihydropteroate synthase [Rickettsiales bacterium]MCP5362193.1 dihydropteroate synthase [Hyphomicrobiales bacterium]